MPATFKQSLEKLIREKAPGPSASFSVFHVLLALVIIAEKTVGRSKLAEELNVGEGVTRTLVGRLRDAGLIATSKEGCSLTDKGLRLWKEYESVFKMTEIGKSELTFGDYNFAILIKSGGHKVKSGMEQRDAAVMAGAKGATTMLFKKGRLIFPSTNKDVAEDFPKASNQIPRLLRLEENDAIIIASSDSLRKAEYGALAAAWTLLDDNQEIV
jgi:predicted transcriptional regulator